MTVGWRTRLFDQISALWKLALSFRKTDWQLSDYPVRIRTQEPHLGSQRIPPYAATIIKWSVSGTGNTPDEALYDLNNSFEAVKRRKQDEGKPLPRPGTDVPLEYASQDRINKHQELADDFVRRILGLEWAWISDESSLWHFHEDASNDRLLDRIKQIYGVDVSDVESANISEILCRIAASKSNG